MVKAGHGARLSIVIRRLKDFSVACLPLEAVTVFARYQKGFNHLSSAEVSSVVI
jgi:hypothetical protein